MTTVPQKISRSLDNVPDDILKIILITLPYQEILDKCSISKQYARICRDRTFWSDKAKQDFGVPTPIFNKKQEQPSKVYFDYLIVHEVTEFLIEVFKFGMYIRGWSGQGPYPDQYKTQQNQVDVLRKLSNAISVYSNSIKPSKEIIEHIPILQKLLKNNDKYISQFFKITGALDPKSLLQSMFTFHYISKMTEKDKNRKSAILIATAVVSLDTYGKNIQNYSISDLERMKIPIISLFSTFSSWQNRVHQIEKTLIEISEQGSITQDIFDDPQDSVEETITIGRK